MNMVEQSKPPKVFCEIVPVSDLDNGSKSPARFDFYGDMGMIASCYDIYIASVVRAEIQMLGYVVEDFPDVSKGGNT